jgi:hypothetical protein
MPNTFHKVHVNQHNQEKGAALTFILLMWTFRQAPNNANKWEMGFKSVA